MCQMSANRRLCLPKLEPAGWRVARSALAAVSRPRSSPIKRFLPLSQLIYAAAGSEARRRTDTACRGESASQPQIVSVGTEEWRRTRGSASAAELGLAAHQLRVCPPLKRSCVKAQDVNPFTTQRASNFTRPHQIPPKCFKYEQPREYLLNCSQAIKGYSNMVVFCTTVLPFLYFILFPIKLVTLLREFYIGVSMDEILSHMGNFTSPDNF